MTCIFHLKTPLFVAIFLVSSCETDLYVLELIIFRSCWM
jgi:hypothetical protein